MANTQKLAKILAHQTNIFQLWESNPRTSGIEGEQDQQKIFLPYILHNRWIAIVTVLLIA